MSEINLGALTDEAQQSKKSSQEIQEGAKDPIAATPSLDEENERKVVGPRITLTRSNIQRLELIKLSNKSERNHSRTSLVNQIIEEFFTERSEQLASEVKSVLESLKE